MSLVSVVIPTYNRAEWLPATVQSVLQQTHPAEEILIIDDGSEDNTNEVCASFPPPVRYIRQANAGVSAARNHGVREARGDWVAFLDSDDLWDATKLEVQLAALAATPDAGWSITECVLINDRDEPALPRRGLDGAVPVFGDLAVSSREFFSATLRQAEIESAAATHEIFTGDLYGALFQGNAVLPSSAIVRRDLFLEVGGFDEQLRVAEDTEFFHRLAAASAVSVVMSPLLRWRVGHEERLTANANTRDLVLNALLSNGRAAAIRQPLSDAEERARRTGRQRLLLRAGYLHLSLLERREARMAIRGAWQEGVAQSGGSLGVYVAALLPTSLLRGLHRVKKLLNG